MTREDWKDWMLVVGGLLLFGSATLYVASWVASLIWAVLPLTLLVGLLIFGAAYFWDQATQRTVTITHEPEAEEEGLRKAA